MKPLPVRLLPGDIEILSRAGTIAPGAAHLHAALSTASGDVTSAHTQGPNETPAVQGPPPP
jgi:predicted DNA-binding protein with PD1-like motif